MHTRYNRWQSILPAATTSLFLGFSLVVAPAQETGPGWLDNNRRFKSDDPTYNFRRSEHFRIFWGQGTASERDANADFKHVTEQIAQGNLQMLERIWHKYHDAPPQGLGFQATGESANPDTRDGQRYRVNLMMNNTGIWAGGAWGSVDDWGYPLFALPPTYLSYDPPSGATPHEYAHTVLISAGGFNDTPWDGMWHESTANWFQLQFLNSYPGPGGVGVQPFLSVPHGRNYYDSWQILEYFLEDARYGPGFINTLWTKANGNKKKGAEYMFDAMVRLDPSGSADPYNNIKDAVGHMAARNVTWDYRRKVFFEKQSPRTMDPFTEMYRRAYTELVRRGGDSQWYRVPFAHAPMQCGYNVVPIALNGKKGGGYKVSLNFRPLWDATRRSDWRATLVAVNDRGMARYSTMWNTGVNSITLAADENQLFLCVAATPDFMPFEGFQRPLISDLPLQPQAYEVAFVNTQATAYETKPARPAGVNGKAHSNGGGFVAETATVAPSAYIGPNAMVLGKAQVLGHARVEDYAVVTDNAVVKDYAWLSGHAMVRENGKVSDYGKVRDWATVGGRWEVSGHGRALERAFLLDRGELSGNATIKGNVPDYGGAKVTGHAIKEGDCANSANVDRQVLMCWVWGIDQKYADDRPDTGGLYCNFPFSRSSPIYALDRFGVLHGYLMGDPETVKLTSGAAGALKLNGKDQYVELKPDVADFRETTYAIWVNWGGGAADQRVWHFGDGAGKYFYLTPKDGKTGKLKVVIAGQGVGSEQVLQAGTALPVGKWTHVAVTFNGDTGTLYVDGREVGTNPGFTWNPDQVLASNTLGGIDHNYIGRGSRGGYFKGFVSEFRAYVRPQDASVIKELAASMPGGSPVEEKPDSEAPQVAGNEFLLKPTPVSDTAVVMSAPKGSDASQWVEYAFVCTSGNGRDSGWISNNRYTDCDLQPGKTYAYAYKLRDKHGNETRQSQAAKVTLPKAGGKALMAKFEQGPRGISATAIRMEATRSGSGSTLVEYRFIRDDGKTSGWQSSRTWVDSGLAEGARHSYTLEVRDAWGNEAKLSQPLAAVARDDTPPARYPVGEWQTYPTATLKNTIEMRAMSVTGEHGAPRIEQDGGVEYYFQCEKGNGPDSGWIKESRWETPVLSAGEYAYSFKMRDVSPQKNESASSSVETVRVSAKTGYHEFPLAKLSEQPEGTLVVFSGTVTDVGETYYSVSAGSSSIKVLPQTVGRKTDASLNGREVTVKGCIWKYAGEKQVSWAELKTSDHETATNKN